MISSEKARKNEFTVSSLLGKGQSCVLSETEYKAYDDLGLYDSVIESLTVDHKNKSITFKILKVVGKVDRSNGRNFTYRVRNATLTFYGVLFANVPYGMEWDEWSEFYRSAILSSSKTLERIKRLPIGEDVKNKLKHIYLGIDNGNDYKEIDIICSNYSLTLQDEEFILHDDFDWLYEKYDK
jgi:hypothetical protein